MKKKYNCERVHRTNSPVIIHYSNPGKEVPIRKSIITFYIIILHTVLTIISAKYFINTVSMMTSDPFPKSFTLFCSTSVWLQNMLVSVFLDTCIWPFSSRLSVLVAHRTVSLKFPLILDFNCIFNVSKDKLIFASLKRLTLYRWVLIQSMD